MTVMPWRGGLHSDDRAWVRSYRFSHALAIRDRIAIDSDCGEWLCEKRNATSVQQPRGPEALIASDEDNQNRRLRRHHIFIRRPNCGIS